MRCFLLILLTCALSFNGLADKESHQRAKRYGATATFRLTVVDDQGKPVPDVTGSAGFWNHRTNTTDSTKSYTTNEKGEIVLSGRSFYDGAFSLEKDGYYKTERLHRFSRGSDDDVEETVFTRNWVPDYVNKEILKKKRDPIPMIARQVRIGVPKLNIPIGFDLERMDWIKPYGKGNTLDMYITLNTKEVAISPQRKWLEVDKVTLAFPNPMDGVQKCELDGWSDFMSMYHVNVKDKFLSNLLLKPDSKDRARFLYGKDYLVFRVRSKRSPSGELIRCNYGKIYPTISAKTNELIFSAIYFNPTVNNTNLEFDPTRNLAPFTCFEEEQQTYNLRP